MCSLNLSFVWPTPAKNYKSIAGGKAMWSAATGSQTNYGPPGNWNGQIIRTDVTFWEKLSHGGGGSICSGDFSPRRNFSVGEKRHHEVSCVRYVHSTVSLTPLHRSSERNKQQRQWRMPHFNRNCNQKQEKQCSDFVMKQSFFSFSLSIFFFTFKTTYAYWGLSRNQTVCSQLWVCELKVKIKQRIYTTKLLHNQCTVWVDCSVSISISSLVVALLLDHLR